jgi:hypothetical protein
VPEAPAPETPAPAESLPPTPTAPAQDLSSSPVKEFTCDDCIYVDTCPNKDQRAPQDCGSFQWR